MPKATPASGPNPRARAETQAEGTPKPYRPNPPPRDLARRGAEACPLFPPFAANDFAAVVLAVRARRRARERSSRRVRTVLHEGATPEARQAGAAGRLGDGPNPQVRSRGLVPDARPGADQTNPLQPQWRRNAGSAWLRPPAPTTRPQSKQCRRGGAIAFHGPGARQRGRTEAVRQPRRNAFRAQRVKRKKFSRGGAAKF